MGRLASALVFVALLLPYVSFAKKEGGVVTWHLRDLSPVLVVLTSSIMQTTISSILAGKMLLDCNIFGGTSSCKQLPRNTSYVNQCPSTATQVDCALYSSVLGNAFDSPVDDLECYLKSNEDLAAKDLCQQCFTNVQSLWCSLAAPKCGTFDTFLSAAILPTLSKVMKAYEKGKSQLEALSTAVPDLVNAMALSLPCREMCNAAISSCGCLASDETFGSLLEWIGTKPAGMRGLDLPKAFSRMLFKDLWDQPFCSIFLPSSTPGFRGTCTATAGSCSQPDKWCDALKTKHSVAFKYIQALLLLQWSRAATGWLVDDNMIFWQTKDAATGKSTNADMDNMRRKYVDGHSDQPFDQHPGGPEQRMSAGQITGIVFLSMFAATLAAAGVVMGVRWYWSRNQHASYFELQDKEPSFEPLP